MKTVLAKNAFERTMSQRGPRLAAARSSWPAAQLGRYTSKAAGMRLRHALAAVLVSLASASAAAAGPSIATETFVLELPEGWITNLNAKPVEARGPGGEVLQLSTAKYSGSGRPDDVRAAVKDLERIALKVVRAVEEDAQFRTTQPLLTKRMPTGDVIHSIVSASRDGQMNFAQFVNVGPRAVVLVSLEVSNSTRSSIEVIRRAVEDTKWQRP